MDAEGSAEAGDAEEGGGSVAEGGGDDSLVCTTGAVSLWPGASNVIAGAANFSVDIRCGRLSSYPLLFLPQASREGSISGYRLPHALLIGCFGSRCQNLHAGPPPMCVQAPPG